MPQMMKALVKREPARGIWMDEAPVPEAGPNEVLLRETGIAATFWFGMQDQKIRRSLTASWAARAFNEHPNADSVSVRVSAYFLPSMAQIRGGTAPAWVPVYDATFRRHAGRESDRRHAGRESDRRAAGHESDRRAPGGAP